MVLSRSRFFTARLKSQSPTSRWGSSFTPPKHKITPLHRSPTLSCLPARRFSIAAIVALDRTWSRSMRAARIAGRHAVPVAPSVLLDDSRDPHDFFGSPVDRSTHQESAPGIWYGLSTSHQSPFWRVSFPFLLSNVIPVHV